MERTALRAAADAARSADQACVRIHYVVATLSVAMKAISFEWDERKNAENKRKHRVSFEEARTVFLDDHARLIADPDHSEDEDRFVLLGMSSAFRTLVVVHTYRRRESAIRIICTRATNRVSDDGRLGE